jgi:two-component system OmpR family sensor kinase
MTAGPGSIGRRLARNLGVSLAALWLAGVIATGAILYHEQGEMLDESLRVTAELLLPLARAEYDRAIRNGTALPVIVGPREGPARDGGRHARRYRELPLFFMLRDGNGTVVARSANAEALDAAGLRQPGFRMVGAYIVYQTPPDAAGFQVVAGGSQIERMETLIESVSLLILMLALLIPLGWLLLRRSLRRATGPMVALNRAIQRRGGANLEPIALADLPAELRPIVEETNRLMVRLRAALSNERAFAANSAHELRTPVAVALAQTHRLIAETDDTAVLDHARQVEEALKRLTSLIERLHQLTRAEAGIGLSETVSDLAPVLRLLVEEFSRKAGTARAIRLHEPLAPLRSRMDPDAFGIVIANLLDNALKHGDPAVPIDVLTPAAGSVAIVNGSAVIPANRLVTLVQRHTRGHTKEEGLGIGLAIVDALTRQAGGLFRLYSPAVSAPGGFEARVALEAGDAIWPCRRRRIPAGRSRRPGRGAARRVPQAGDGKSGR